MAYDRPITFISDRNSGLLEGVARVFLFANHDFYLQHLKANLRDKMLGATQMNLVRGWLHCSMNTHMPPPYLHSIPSYMRWGVKVAPMSSNLWIYTIISATLSDTN